MPDNCPPPPTPEELDALVQREREVTSALLFVARSYRTDETISICPVSDRATATPPLLWPVSDRATATPPLLWPVSDRATATTDRSPDTPANTPTSRHPESEPCEEEGSQAYLHQQLDQLCPETRAFAEILCKRAAGARAGKYSQRKLHAELRDHSFPHWLHFVTQHLAPASQAILIEELWEHYQSALEDAAQRGAGGDPYVEALAALGDARRVRKQLTKLHLTAIEFHWLSGINGTFRRTNLVITILLATCFLIMGSQATTLAILAIALTVLLIILCAKSIDPKLEMKRELVLNLVEDLSMGIMSFGMGVLAVQSISESFAVPFLAMCALLGFSSFPTSLRRLSLYAKKLEMLEAHQRSKEQAQ